MKNNSNIVRTLSTQLSESKHRQNQLQTIFLYLQKNVATASMVTAATGVAQKCITRYKRDLELSGRLWEIERTHCKSTGFKAWYLTTDPNKAPNGRPQLDLFPLDDIIRSKAAEGLNNGL